MSKVRFSLHLHFADAFTQSNLQSLYMSEVSLLGISILLSDTLGLVSGFLLRYSLIGCGFSIFPAESPKSNRLQCKNISKCGLIPLAHLNLEPKLTYCMLLPITMEQSDPGKVRQTEVFLEVKTTKMITSNTRVCVCSHIVQTTGGRL